MRAGASTVQQTLTPEAAAILKHAVADACRRGHAQATPLHVAATLLGAPGSPLRRACLQTHSHSSHLPQCRALELCFSIALERLQAAQGPLPGGQPSYSNALVAALKRAQAHQRRGCPEQQQQPLLAVKVELEQLVISILDDPSVSRVMREAGFSSTDVKNHLEEMVSLVSSHHSATSYTADQARPPWGAALDQMGLRLNGAPSFPGNITVTQHLSQYKGLTLERNDAKLQMFPSRATSLYLNPRIPKPGSSDSFLGGGDDVKRVFEILLKRKRRNPVLVGESGMSVEAVLRELVHRIERSDVPEQLQGVKFVPAQLSVVFLENACKEDLEMKFDRLNHTVEGLMAGGGAIIHLGDLQWLLETLQAKGLAPRQSAFCPVQYAATEMRHLLDRYLGSGRLWLIGIATSHTYLGCQVQHPNLESQWELQPVSIGSSGLSLGLSSRYRSQETVVSSIDSSLSLSLHSSPTAVLKFNAPDEEDGRKLNCCSDCIVKYEKEAFLLREQERHAQLESPQSCSSSVEISSKDNNDSELSMQPTSTGKPVLPLWLQKALPASSSQVESLQAKDKILPLAQKLQELQQKYSRTCRNLHQYISCSNISSEKLRLQSPASSQISGGIAARCQDQSVVFARDNSNVPVVARPSISPISAMIDNQLPYGILGSSHRITTSQNGRFSEHQHHINGHKERVKDSTGSCPSKMGLPWQALTAATPMTPSTEAHTLKTAPVSKQNGFLTRMFRQVDPDAFKHLCKGLAERVGWQKGVISTIANTVMQCRSGMGKRQGVGLKGNAWLLFLGHDHTGKKKMTEALAELIFGSEKKPVCLNFGRQQTFGYPPSWIFGPQQLAVPSRGKLPQDHLAEAVRQNPFSVILLEDVDQADSIFKASLVQSIERGRLLESSGREVSLSNVIVVMTTSIGIDCSDPGITESKTQSAKESFGIESDAALQCKIENADCEIGNGNSENLISADEQQSSGQAIKRKAEWNVEDEPSRSLGSIPKKTNSGRTLALDLNMSAEENEVVDFDATHKMCESGERLEFDEEQILCSAREHLREFCDVVDAAVVFRPRCVI